MLRRECISIGPLCTSSQTLKDMGLRTVAYPFDWIFSDLDMVKHCILDGFKTLLDTDMIVKVGESSSTHKVYTGDSPTFNHHDLSDVRTHAAFKRRCARFLDAYTSRPEGVGMLYMTKSDVWWGEAQSNERNSLADFCGFVAATSPESVVVVMVLCRTGEIKHDVVRFAQNCYVAHIHYGDTDNLAAVRDVLDLVLIIKSV